MSGTDGLDALTFTHKGKSATLRKQHTGKGGGNVAKPKRGNSSKATEHQDDDRPQVFRQEIDKLEKTLAQIGGQIAGHAENVIASEEYVDAIKGAHKLLDKALSSMGDARMALYAGSGMVHEGALTGEQTKLGDE